MSGTSDGDHMIWCAGLDTAEREKPSLFRISDHRGRRRACLNRDEVSVTNQNKHTIPDALKAVNIRGLGKLTSRREGCFDLRFGTSLTPKDWPH